MPGIVLDPEVLRNDNSMKSGTVRSAYMCINRLKRRYGAIDYEHCTRELCYFLRNVAKTKTDPFDRYRVAERAMYPRFGAVGLNRDNNLQTALYYWMAANDTSQDMISSAEDRRDCYVRALYECQRGNNALDSEDHSRNSGRINYIDNRIQTDCTICQWGVNNKFAEVFVGMFPDIQIIDDLQGRILDLITAYIAEHLKLQGKTFVEISSGDLYLPKLIGEPARQTIENTVIEIFGKASDSIEGFLTNTELTFLSSSLGVNLEYIPLNLITSESQMIEMIADAHQQLREARELRALRRSSTATASATIFDSGFDLSDLEKIIKDIIPEPTNQAFVHRTTGYETLYFGQDATFPISDNGLWFDFQPRINFNLADYMRTRTVRHGYTEQQLTNAMQQQSTVLNPAEKRNQRAIAMGMKPNR